MPGPNTRTAGVAVGEVACSSPGRSDGNRLGDDSRAVARGACADQPRHWNGRRQFVDPTARDAEYAGAVAEFQQAMEKYKQRSGRMFPTWSEVLEVLQGLGYEKVAREPVAQGARCEDGGGRASSA
jgi:hypothetical protein